MLDCGRRPEYIPLMTFLAKKYVSITCCPIPWQHFTTPESSLEVYFISNLQYFELQQYVPEAELLRSLIAFPLPIPSSPLALVLASRYSLSGSRTNKPLQPSNTNCAHRRRKVAHPQSERMNEAGVWERKEEVRVRMWARSQELCVDVFMHGMCIQADVSLCVCVCVKSIVCMLLLAFSVGISCWNLAFRKKCWAWKQTRKRTNPVTYDFFHCIFTKCGNYKIKVGVRICA